MLLEIDGATLSMSAQFLNRELNSDSCFVLMLVPPNASAFLDDSWLNENAHSVLISFV